MYELEVFLQDVVLFYTVDACTFWSVMAGWLWTMARSWTIYLVGTFSTERERKVDESRDAQV